MTVSVITLYVIAALVMKALATHHFRDRLNQWGVNPTAMMTAPTPMNIFCWRGLARDDDKYYVSYWSLFDSAEREDSVASFSRGHQLEGEFRNSREYQTLKWFTKGWRKTYQTEDEPNAIYIAALMMGEMREDSEDGVVFKPPFIWKITKTESGYTLDRPYKMSKDVWGRLDHAGALLTALTRRVAGGEPEWMEGDWIWERDE